ncbi:MAG: hypothetical protein DRP27_10290 [Thermotogae bacterium]|nr:MAG: hypothetical protein DRP27_10290 [Thermotogota bacterium]
MVVSQGFLFGMLIVFVLVQLATSIVAGLWNTVWGILAASVAAYVFLLWFLWKNLKNRGYDLKAELTRNPRKAVIVGSLMYPLELVVITLLSLLIPVNAVDAGIPLPGGNASPFAVAVLMLVLSGLGPVVEEVAFRGVLYPTLKSRIRPELAVVLASVIFGFFHPFSTFVHMTVLSIFLIYAYEISGSILASVVLHALNNAVSLIVLLLM